MLYKHVGPLSCIPVDGSIRFSFILSSKFIKKAQHLSNIMVSLKSFLSFGVLGSALTSAFPTPGRTPGCGEIDIFMTYVLNATRQHPRRTQKKSKLTRPYHPSLAVACHPPIHLSRPRVLIRFSSTSRSQQMLPTLSRPAITFEVNFLYPAPSSLTLNACNHLTRENFTFQCFSWDPSNPSAN